MAHLRLGEPLQGRLAGKRERSTGQERQSAPQAVRPGARAAGSGCDGRQDAPTVHSVQHQQSVSGLQQTPFR